MSPFLPKENLELDIWRAWGCKGLVSVLNVYLFRFVDISPCSARMESSKLMSWAVPLPDAWRNCRFLIFLFPFGYFDVECTDVQEVSTL